MIENTIVLKPSRQTKPQPETTTLEVRTHRHDEPSAGIETPKNRRMPPILIIEDLDRLSRLSEDDPNVRRFWNSLSEMTPDGHRRSDGDEA